MVALGRDDRLHHRHNIQLVSHPISGSYLIFETSILTHADFPVFNTCSSRAKWSTVSILISFAPKIIPEHRTNYIWNISEARLKEPNSQKVILILLLTFFVDTHGSGRASAPTCSHPRLALLGWRSTQSGPTRAVSPQSRARERLCKFIRKAAQTLSERVNKVSQFRDRGVTLC